MNRNVRSNLVNNLLNFLTVNLQEVEVPAQRKLKQRQQTAQREKVY